MAESDNPYVDELRWWIRLCAIIFPWTREAVKQALTKP